MKGRLTLVGLAVLLAGCGNSSEPAAVPGAGAGAATVALSADAPRLDAGSLGILVKDGTEKVQVGMSQDRAQEIFKSPSNILPIDTLPKNIPAETYDAGGWETIDENSGFGFIGVKATKEIAVAIRTRRFDKEEDADAEVQQYTQAFQGITDHIDKPFVISGAITYDYSFWQEGGNRLMVLKAPSGKRWQVTAMVGEKSLMDALRASLATAQQDIVRLDAMRKDATPAKSESSTPK